MKGIDYKSLLSQSLDIPLMHPRLVKDSSMNFSSNIVNLSTFHIEEQALNEIFNIDEVK